MQAALEVTARYCGRELEQYGQCVAAKPESWQRDCHHLKMSIAQCTSSQRSH
uniref:Coiled-coil-helix-coiled-coil-helix domain containing 5 n=1 Tax=Lynx canadensis TaxID=61383 RepID=A0A667H8B1_LYNCA